MMSGQGTTSSNNVFVLGERRSNGFSELNKIEQYWETLRGKRLVPSRSEIDPRGLQGVLGHTFILERIAGGLARFRIAGSQISEIAGIELRQMPLSALVLASSRELLSEAVNAAFEDPAIVRMRIRSPAGYGRAELTGEMLLLPLRSDTGEIDRILGGIVLNGTVGRSPRRIEIEDQTRRSLVGYAGPLPQDLKSRRDAFQSKRFAHQSHKLAKQAALEVVHSQDDVQSRPVDRSHLRLVVG